MLLITDWKPRLDNGKSCRIVDRRAIFVYSRHQEYITQKDNRLLVVYPPNACIWTSNSSRIPFLPSAKRAASSDSEKVAFSPVP